jgi:hypothetical protein
MANWQRSLNLWPEYGDCDPGNGLEIRALASVVAARLSNLRDFVGPGTADINARRQSLIVEFKTVAGDVQATKEDFNRVMVWLWQWADQELPHPPTVTGSQVPKVCWVSTQEGI